MIPVFAAPKTPFSRNWTLVRALKESFPGLAYLKDLLSNADHSVFYTNIGSYPPGLCRPLLAGGGGARYRRNALGTTLKTVLGSSQSSSLNATTSPRTQRQKTLPLLPTRQPQGTCPAGHDLQESDIQESDTERDMQESDLQEGK